MNRANAEREKLSGFLGTVSEFLTTKGLMSPKFRSAFASSRLKSFPIGGIRQATNDVIEMTCDLDGEMLEAIDEELQRHDLPTLSAMRDQSYRKAQAIIGRGNIKSNTEWYLLKGLISHVDGSPLSRMERQVAEDLVGNYLPSEKHDEA